MKTTFSIQIQRNKILQGIQGKYTLVGEDIWKGVQKHPYFNDTDIELMKKFMNTYNDFVKSLDVNKLEDYSHDVPDMNHILDKDNELLKEYDFQTILIRGFFEPYVSGVKKFLETHNI